MYVIFANTRKANKAPKLEFVRPAVCPSVYRASANCLLAAPHLLRRLICIFSKIASSKQPTNQIEHRVRVGVLGACAFGGTVGLR